MSHVLSGQQLWCSGDTLRLDLSVEPPVDVSSAHSPSDTFVSWPADAFTQTRPADAATYVMVTLHGPLPQGTSAVDVVAALVAASGFGWPELDPREVVLPSDAAGSTGCAVVFTEAATQLAAKEWVPLGTGRMRLSVGAGAADRFPAMVLKT